MRQKADSHQIKAKTGNKEQSQRREYYDRPKEKVVHGVQPYAKMCQAKRAKLASLPPSPLLSPLFHHDGLGNTSTKFEDDLLKFHSCRLPYAILKNKRSWLPGRDGDNETAPSLVFVFFPLASIKGMRKSSTGR